MTSLIGALRVTLGLDTAAFEKGATRAEARARASGNQMEALGKKIGGIGKAMAAAGAAIAGAEVINQVRSMAREGLEYAASLDEQAQQLGVTTSALQKFRYIAENVGVEQEVMDKGLVKLNGKLGDLAVGAAGAEKPFGRLKLSQQELAQLSKMNAEQALPFLADKFKLLGSETERVAAMQELFGEKMGGKFISLLAGGSVAIDKLAAAYKAAGIEISPEDLAKANQALDDLGTINLAYQAEQARWAVKNIAVIQEGEKAWAEAKVKAITFMTDIEGVVTRFENFSKGQAEENRIKWQAYGLAVENAGKGIAKFVREGAAQIQQMAQSVGKWLVSMGNQGVESVAKLANGVKVWLQDKLGATVKWVQDKLKALGDSFFTLYDRVVGHSYVPDLVDGIADHFARLDGVMTQPAQKAAAATAATFKKLKDDLDPLMRSLFPEAAAAADFARDRAILNAAAGGKAGYNADQIAEAQRRLSLRSTPESTTLQDFLAGSEDPLELTAKIQEQLRKLSGAANENSKEVMAANVRIVKSFKDMANDTLSALQELTGAIKGGGFLDILSGLIGLGLELGGSGLFGKKIAANINGAKIPAFAGGTGYAPGGLALVGERGPELVDLPRGSRVYPNGTGPGGGGNTYYFSGVMSTDDFLAQIEQGHQRAARAGARGGVQLAQRRSARRVG